eukprot:CAMPEP_0202955590 /NCGR_PEP_ID=MMETSP1396-20130829/141_1 /ASSEMBLY_ACC=CAM_ASM_000872 /TAXON_ID= /ORGANISM="Pseudokeronopsis sp., Strain Brazil" /LENGTH=180 /DNA_ID=CAMNT_0049672239 /DNA_START=64 /DNA_END=606 /DNA_ORIENTATION=-
MEAHVVLCVDHEVAGVNVVSLEDLFEDFRLVDGAFLHEVDDLVLDDDLVVDVVVELHLNFVLELSALVEELLLVWFLHKVLVVLRDEVEIADSGPRVVAISHWVLGHQSHVLATPQQEHLVHLLVEVLPVEGVGKPAKRSAEVEQHCGELPRPAEWIYEEHVPSERDHGVEHAVRVLQVD